MELIHTLTSLFGALALLVIIAAGFVMMFSPKPAWRMLKNAMIALLIFITGSILLQSVCSASQHAEPRSMSPIIVLMLFAGAMLLIVSGAAYLWNSKLALDGIKRGGLILLASVVAILCLTAIADEDSLVTLLGLMAVSYAAYRIREWRRKGRKSQTPKMTRGAERKPLMPREEKEE